MVALAHMGGDEESRIEATRRATGSPTCRISTRSRSSASPAASAVWYPRTGLPDEAFEHDGKLTKREFRALALAKLMPHPGALLWDIGAGCGSIGIEWMRAARPRAAPSRSSRSRSGAP